MRRYLERGSGSPVPQVAALGLGGTHEASSGDRHRLTQWPFVLFPRAYSSPNLNPLPVKLAKTLDPCGHCSQEPLPPRQRRLLF